MPVNVRIRVRALFLPVTMILIGAAMTGCASLGKVSARDRATIHNVNYVTPPQGAIASLYHDQTQDVLNSPLLGGILPTLAAEGIRASGANRWKPVTAGKENLVAQAVREQLQNAFAQNRQIQSITNSPVDGTVSFALLQYGVSHRGNKLFSPMVNMTVQLRKPDGKLAWMQTAWGTSTSIQLTQEQFQQDPKSFMLGIEEAARLASNALVNTY